ncbi:YtxH domain-containing protein [Lysinibacillus sp. NPDC093712]|uniref:YtxH domain-containing protein n=1 Tax=Lysinibacillus sp. NPDC093712 TaxID=3390579 RepID=UPI003CFC100F
MKAQPFLIGLTTGIIGGAIAVLFSTPKSGQQLRSTILSNTDSAKLKLQDVKHQVNNVKQSVGTLTNEAKNNIPQIINDLKHSITIFTQEIEPTKNNLQQEIEALQNSINEIEKNVAQFTDKKKKPQEKVQA